MKKRITSSLVLPHIINFQSVNHKVTVCILATLALGISSGSAAVITSSSAPTVDGADQSNFTWDTASRDKVFDDAPAGVSKNIGQAFTTGSDLAGYQLNGWSTMLDSVSDAPQDMTFTLRLVEIAGDNTSTTTVALESGLSITGTEWLEGDWISWNFTTPVSLSANTLYGIDIEMTAAGAWQNGIPYVAYNNADVFAGGFRYTLNDGDPSVISPSTSADRVFHVDMAAVPEPSSFALIASSLALTSIMLRRRSS